MKSVKITQIILKDLVDLLLINMIFFVLINFSVVKLNHNFIIFPEKILDIIFDDPKILLIFISYFLFTCVSYFVICYWMLGSTIGMRLARIKYDHMRNYQVLLLSTGAFLEIIFLYAGRFYAWWLDSQHRGFAERLARVGWYNKKSSES